MTRETKAQRLEREADEASARDANKANKAAQYLPKLMTVLESATNLNNYELTVTEGLFRVRDRDAERWETPVLLSPTYTQSNWDKLEDLEFELEFEAKARAEAERRYAVKQAALAKLSSEERELLGL
jgi:hypothetical protein